MGSGLYFPDVPVKRFRAQSETNCFAMTKQPDGADITDFQSISAAKQNAATTLKLNGSAVWLG
jgi:hypothetical protein